MTDHVISPSDLDYSPKPTSLTDEVVPYQAEGKSFGIRALAYILDVVARWLIDYGVSFVVGFVFGFLLFATGQEYTDFNESTLWLEFGISLVMTLLYFTLFEGLYGASPGKLLTGMRVVKEDGTPCDLRTAMHRGLWRFIDVLFFGAIAYLNMKPPLRQRVGDKSAHTLVVSKNEPLIQRPRGWDRFVLALAIYMVFEAAATVLWLAIMIW